MIEKDHLGNWSPEKDWCWWLTFQWSVQKQKCEWFDWPIDRVAVGKWVMWLANHITWLWWLLHWFLKLQSQTTVLLRTPITQMIFFQSREDCSVSVYSLYNNDYYSLSSYLTSVPQIINYCNSFLELTFLLFLFYNISLILLRQKKIICIKSTLFFRNQTGFQRIWS